MQLWVRLLPFDADDARDRLDDRDHGDHRHRGDGLEGLSLCDPMSAS
jgi:hypothetical protein